MQYAHLCKVTIVVLEQKLAYTWRYEGYDGNSEVTWELFVEDKKTRLILTHTGLESFPQTGSFERSSFTEGWNYILGKSLMEFIEPS